MKSKKQVIDSHIVTGPETELLLVLDYFPTGSPESYMSRPYYCIGLELLATHQNKDYIYELM